MATRQVKITTSSDIANRPLGVFPIMAYRGRPEWGTLFRILVCERVGILIVEVYKRVGKSVIWVCERAQRANR